MVMSTSISVLIVDDQPRARQSLHALLSTSPQIISIGQAANGLEAVRYVEQSQPDAVLMDLRMPVMDGLEATRHIKARWPHVRVIILSMYTDRAEEALAAGADAFVSKGEPAERLLDALRVSH
jgi:NarL family two-component system response regulator LiaR